MVNVYEEADYNEEIIGQVEYTENLDHWDGSNWTSGGVGQHEGLSKLEDGRYVLIYGTQWQGQKDYGETISREEAVQKILQSGNHELFKEYPELEELRKETILGE